MQTVLWFSIETLETTGWHEQQVLGVCTYWDTNPHWPQIQLFVNTQKLCQLWHGHDLPPNSECQLWESWSRTLWLSTHWLTPQKCVSAQTVETASPPTAPTIVCTFCPQVSFTLQAEHISDQHALIYPTIFSISWIRTKSHDGKTQISKFFDISRHFPIPVTLSETVQDIILLWFLDWLSYVLSKILENGQSTCLFLPALPYNHLYYSTPTPGLPSEHLQAQSDHQILDY